MKLTAVTGLNSRVLLTAVAVAQLIVPARAAESPDVLATIHIVTRALADDNAPGAMAPFSKSFRDFSKLQDYFSGLTDRGQIVSEVDVNNTSCSPTECKATFTWTMNITNNAVAGDTEQRTAEIHMRSILDHDTWKIVELGPIEFFSPAPRPRHSQ